MNLGVTLNGVFYTPQRITLFADTATNTEEKEFFTEVVSFLQEWFNSSEEVLVNTSGSTGEPKPLLLRKEHMVNSARMTCSYFNLTKGSTALLCMPVRYIAGKMMLVRAVVAQLTLKVVCPSSRPLLAIKQDFEFVAMVPLQVFTSLKHVEDIEALNRVKYLLIGGGAIDKGLLSKIENLLCSAYSSYGMTETVSHIALRKLNGPNKSAYYTPLPNVTLSQTKDGTLEVDAPYVSSQRLSTNDLVEFDALGNFVVLGRIDNIINSGGVKLQAEKIEEKLQNLFDSPYVITSAQSARLGDVVSLLIGGEPCDLTVISQEMKGLLTKYELPKLIYFIPEIPQTETHKIDRAACRALANELYKKDKNESNFSTQRS